MTEEFEAWEKPMTSGSTREIKEYRRDQAERWLKRVMSLKRRVDTLSAEIEEHRSIASGLSSVESDGMPKPPNSSPDSIPNAIIRLHELIADYVTELRGYVEEQDEAHRALLNIEDEQCREVLTRHYLLSRSWERCCVEMNYTYDGIMKLRRRALLKAYDVMPHRWRDPLHQAI